MKLNHVFTLLFFLWSFAAISQEEQTAVLTVSQGKVRYQSPDGGKFTSVASGALLRNTGKLKLSGKAAATVYCNGKFETLAKGRYNLSEVCGEATSMRRMNFDTKFGEHLQAAIFMAAAANGHNSGWAGITDPKKTGDGWGVTDPKKTSDGWGVTDPKKTSDGWGVRDPKKTSDGWGVRDPKKTSDGWGGQGSDMVLILPFGKILAGKARFYWSRPADAESYTLRIMDGDDKEVHTATLRDTFVELDLSAISLAAGSVYSWNVSAKGGTSIMSNTLQFVIDSQENLTGASDRLESSKLYASADPATKGMMEATALEQKEWFVPAAAKYRETAQKHPDNNLLRMMHAAFWMRCGLPQLADQAVMK